MDVAKVGNSPISPPALTTNVTPAKDWSERATPRAQTRHDFEESEQRTRSSSLEGTQLGVNCYLGGSANHSLRYPRRYTNVKLLRTGRCLPTGASRLIRQQVLSAIKKLKSVLCEQPSPNAGHCAILWLVLVTLIENGFSDRTRTRSRRMPGGPAGGCARSYMIRAMMITHCRSTRLSISVETSARLFLKCACATTVSRIRSCE